MRVLLVESTPGNGKAVSTWLQRTGHEIATCFDSPLGLGCRGVDHHDDCPLGQPTDLAVLVRDLDGGARSLTEMGAVCALRHRVPLVELTEPCDADLDATLLSALADAVADGPCAGYVAAVREAIGRVGALADPESVGVTVRREPNRVHAMLDVPTAIDDDTVPMIVDWSSRALRAHDPYVKVIDVGVRRV